MEALFLRTVTVSLAVSLLLLPLLFLRGWLEKRYAPQTRWLVWLGVAAVLLIAPLLPRMTAPVQVEVPARTVAYTQVGTVAPAAVPAPAPAVKNPVITPNQPIQPGMGAAAAPAPVTYRSVDWTELAAALWLAVAGVLLAVQAVRYGVTRRRLFRASRPVESRKEAELRVLTGLETPIAMGFFRPVVFLPAEETDPMALRHELKHIQRRDTWGKAFLFLACVLHWFNPLVWRMARWADRDVEACCDAAVVGEQDTAYKRAYGELLLASAAGERSLPFTTRFGGGKEQMKSRLAQLFRPGKRSRVLVCALLAAAVLLSGLVACTQQPPAETAKDPEPSAGEEIKPAVEDARPLTENTMPTLVYYDPDRDFLLYRTLDAACFHYGDSHEEFRPDQLRGRRVIWRCDVSEDEKTVYLSDVFDDSDDRDERFYAWDIDTRTLKEVDSIPPGVDHTTHVGGEELINSGYLKTADLRSNALKTADGTVVALTIDSTLGDGTLPYLCFTWAEPGKYSQTRFLTPEKIPAPQDYTDPDWGFTLHLPESLEGNYVVSRAANNWNFYAKDLYPTGQGYLFSLWAEDFDTQQMTIDSYDGLWSGKIPGEKNGITYLLTTWDEEHISPTERENKTYMTMLRDSWNITADDLDLTSVTRSSGYLWPLPYTEYGSDRLLSEENNTLQILSPEGLPVQSIARGKVVRVMTAVRPTENGAATGDKVVIVAHPDGRYSEYGHLEYLQLENGVDVERGEIIGFAKADGDYRWLEFRLLEGGDSWYNATAVDPWSVEYRTYDFLPVTHDTVTIAGDPAIGEALRSVLRGELAFYDTETGESCFATALPDSDGLPVTVYRYAQVDMDNDTIPEVVLWLERGGNEYVMGSIILRYEKGGVYGYPMSFRAMNLLNLKRDGTYNWSGGASNNGWGRKDFYRNETIDQPEEGQEAKEDVIWYEMTEENIARIY